MDLMVKYMYLVFQVCAIASSVFLQGSSGQNISPSASFSAIPPVAEGSPANATQKQQIASNSFGPTSQPNASPHFDSASGPQANKHLEPSSSSLNVPPPVATVLAPSTSKPEESPPIPPVIQPTIPVPPVPQPDNGPDTKSPASPPTSSALPVQIAPPPTDTLQAPPSVPQAPPVTLPGPVASPPTKLPMASPPPFPTLITPPANLPLPALLPPSTLPSPPPASPALPAPPKPTAPPASSPSALPTNSPPSPPTLNMPPPNLPGSAPEAPPPGTLPTNSSLSPPTLSIPPPNLPAPVASSPSTLPMNSPPSPPTLNVPPPSLPAPVASPPSTIPTNSPPSPPTFNVPPPSFPDPVAAPPSTIPTNSPPSPPTSNVSPPSFPDPVVAPPSSIPTNSPPSPPTLNVPPPGFPDTKASPPVTLPTNSPPRPPTLNILPPNLPAPIASPPSTFPTDSPPSPPTLNVHPPNSPARVASPPPTSTITPPNLPVISEPVASPPNASKRNLPPPQPTAAEPPSNSPAPPRNSPKNLQPIHHNSSTPPPNLPEPHISPVSTPIPSTHKQGDTVPVSSLPNRTTNIAPTQRPPVKAPVVHRAPRPYDHAPPPHLSYESPPRISHSPPPLPPSYPPPPPGPKSRPTHHSPPPSSDPNSPPRRHATPNPDSPMPSNEDSISPSISPSTSSPPVQTTIPVVSPSVAPRLPPRIPKPIQALPPPPPNEDCSSITCMEPLTNTPPGIPCKCVMPMQVELGLTVALYTFFPLVSELAFEMASGLFMRSSQVRIMGANENEDSLEPQKTIVIVDLVPLGEKFDNVTASLTAQRLWLKQMPIKSSLFGDYDVLFVKYPGLPPSPPLPYSRTGMNGKPYGQGSNGMDVKPLGVDVSKQTHGNKLNGGVIAVISFSVIVAVVLVCVAIWVRLYKRRDGAHSGPTPPATLLSVTKSSGAGASIGSGPESASLSFRSSIAYNGSAKTFSLSDMAKATDNFNESGVLGEGGFGRVYSGVLEDGTKVAVKVLKRDDQQGAREFLAEVEMLSRLHHRNLVRLIGICIEERNRCLVYELIPNGSVDSHLHGIDKETEPLDWAARLKIALGAARGLAYLHEDSSPRVIHRDFKASNILLEHDWTPKVSDFGLARTALDEENQHISTRVMGTFGYVAPEYAMTGHLLVKSDVYSYGVVLLELLTGRKPVDMSMPLGQENLVAWARPLLSTPEGLNLLIDPSLKPEVRFDSIAKVAAIASTCVQPEVSHRPFMGEVVQALKLVCNECEETRDLGSRSGSHEDLASMEFDPRLSPNAGPAQPKYPGYESPLDVESGFSTSGLGLDVDAYRITSSSGPLRPRRRLQLWERMTRFSSGSMNDYGDFLRLLSRSR